METYLKEQYDVFEDEKYLTSEDEIQDYFEDNGREFLDCGQGYYEDTADLICKVGDKFYSVSIEAEVISQKQDVGDRIYWVENITKVSYEEIDKPKPRDKTLRLYNLYITDEQKELLEEFLKENNMEVKK